jgi:hypothetical protein
VKTLKVPIRDEARTEGHTQVELAAKVRRRAYKLYEERGKTDGHAVEDWAQAEAEILRRKRDTNGSLEEGFGDH